MPDYWSKHILDWIANNLESPPSPARFRTVENILLNYGWEPDKYLPEFKQDLQNWLSRYYTLSTKIKPTPATSDNEEIHLKKVNYVGYCGRLFPEDYLVESLTDVTCERCYEKGRRSL